MFDKLLHVVLEVMTFCGLVIVTIFITKFGFDYYFKFLGIEPYSQVAYGYMTTVYSFFIAFFVIKVDGSYRRIQRLEDKLRKLQNTLGAVEQEEEMIRDNVIRSLSK